MKIVKYPKPSLAGYDPNRPLHKNQLILKQVEHFHQVEKNLPEHLRTDTDIQDVKTEGEAAEYIARVTKAIHEVGGRPPKKVRPTR
jgi:hypothetical protein